MKKLLLVCFVVFLFSTFNAAADTWILPAPFEIQSKDGSKTFRFDPNPNNPSIGYSVAALYDNSNPPKVIYTVENLRSWAYEMDFFFFEDFQHFAFIPQAEFDIALEFYSNGILNKTYYIKKLVKNHDKITYSTTKAWWLKEGTRIYQKDNTLILTTVDDLTYKFDIATGSILKDDENSSSNWRTIRQVASFTVVGICIIENVLFILIRHKHIF